MIIKNKNGKMFRTNEKTCRHTSEICMPDVNMKKNWTVIYRNKNNLSFRAVRCQSKKAPHGVKQARKALFKTLQQGRGIEFNSVETKSRGGLSAGLTW